MVAIWICGFSATAPILFNTKLHVEKLPDRAAVLLGVSQRLYCFEDWSLENGRLYYSLIVAGVQFLLPSGVLILAHASIYLKLSRVGMT